MYNRISKKHAGFTLIEMMMVLLIIGATMKIVAVSFEDIAFTARYEQTISRLDTMRQAIIGNPKRTINGQPDISGFVSDMGRLPINVRELISSAAFCIDSDYGTNVSNDTLFGTKALCEGASHTWHEIASVTGPNPNQGNLIAGWQGPYIQVNDAPNSTSTDIFPDGWGNEANTVAAFEYFYDYGWYWCHWDTSDDTANSATANNLPDDLSTTDGFPDCNNADISSLEHLSIYSLGKNGTGDVAPEGSVTCGANGYDGDCYTTILEDDYTLDISPGLSVSFIKPLSSSVPISSFCSNPSFTTKSTCTANNTEVTPTAPYGKWYGGCEKNGYINKSSCENISLGNSTWHLCSDSSSSNKNDCKSASAIWFGEGYGCKNNTSVDKTTCEAALGVAADSWRSCSDNGTIILESACANQNWYGYEMPVNVSTSIKQYQNKSICMKVFYRNAADSTIVPTVSDAIPISENGSYQTFNFSTFKDSSDNPISNIPMGLNAIGIYEYNGSSCKTSTMLYPSDRKPIVVQFIPHTTLPIINW